MRLGTRIAAVVALVVAMGVGVPRADAVTGGTLALTGVHHFPTPIDLVSTNVLPTKLFYFLGTCTQVTAHVAEPKPTAVVAAGCQVEYQGVYTGNCAAGWGSGGGRFVDGLGQFHAIEVTFVVHGPVWRFVWTVRKATGQTGVATGNGGWAPSPVDCVNGFATTAPAAAHVTLALV